LGIFVVLARVRDGVTRGTTDVPGDMLTRKPERVINSAVDLMNILLPCATLKKEKGKKKKIALSKKKKKKKKKGGPPLP